MKINATKKSIFLLTFIIIFVIFFYFLFKINNNNQISREITEIKQENNNVNIINEKKDLGEREIITTKIFTISDCDEMENEKKTECLDEAYANDSFIKNDLSLCLKIEDYNKMSHCIYRGIRKLLSTSACKRIPDHMLAATCISDVSINIRQLDFCDVFEGEPYEKTECSDRTKSFIYSDKGAINDCIDITTLEYKNLCYMKMKIPCDEIKDKVEKNICISLMLYPIALNKDDCDKIPTDVYRKVCLEKYSEENINKKSIEIDTDGDGLSNDNELFFDTDPFDPDTDKDGLTDYEEIIENKGGNPVNTDTDHDGLSDFDEVQLGTDPQKPDTDDDGVLDSADKDPLSGDSDSDGLTDAEELLWGTDPNKKDTDGDGMSDYDEVKNGKNPLGEGWKQDTDGDGLIDVDEIFYLTDPLKPDTDGDGVTDKDEIEAGTNPLGPGDFDFDGDRLSDKEEDKLGTNKYKSDTNGDGITDFDSVKKGLDPISKDTDGDGLNNIYEIKNSLDPIKSDTDGDGLSDGDELNKYFTNPKDLDTDNDGFLDGEEVQAGFDPRNASGV